MAKIKAQPNQGVCIQITCNTEHRPELSSIFASCLLSLNVNSAKKTTPTLPTPRQIMGTLR